MKNTVYIHAVCKMSWRWLAGRIVFLWYAVNIRERIVFHWSRVKMWRNKNVCVLFHWCNYCPWLHRNLSSLRQCTGGFHVFFSTIAYNYLGNNGLKSRNSTGWFSMFQINLLHIEALKGGISPNICLFTFGLSCIHGRTSSQFFILKPRFLYRA